MLGGRDLGASGAALNDHLHFVTAAACQGEVAPMYVGFGRSRISERISEFVDLPKYSQWADRITDRLNSSFSQKNPTLGRFARPIRAPLKSEASLLLLDLGEFGENFKAEPPANELVFGEDFMSAACEVAADGSFQVKLGENTVSGKVTYEKGRFRIKSPELNAQFKPKAIVRQSASSFLSQPRFAQIVTSDELIYADGRFFKPSRLHGRSSVIDPNMVVGLRGLATAGELPYREKGQTNFAGKVTWQKGSLFHYIDTNKELYSAARIRKDVLICDDVNSEICDFIAIDKKREVIVFMHAKTLHGPNLSAKELHEVVSQAKKNLGFLDPSATFPEARLQKKWAGKWSQTPCKLWRIRKGGRRTPKGAGSLVKLVSSMLRSTSVRKEVWLVLGCGFGQENFNKALAHDDIPDGKYNWLQLFYLIHSCSASAAAVNARLRIFTAP